MKREKEFREVGFEYYFENCSDLLCKTDPDGNLNKINRNWLQILDYQLSEMEGQPITKFVHPDDHKKIISLLKNIVRNKKAKNNEIRFKNKKGPLLWIECRPFIVEGLIYISAHDITKTKQTEDNFRNLTKLHKTVLDSVVTGMIYTRQNKIFWANNAFLNMFNCTLQDIKGQHLSFFIRNKNVYEKLQEEAMATFSKGEIYIQEIEVYNENGNVRWINLSGTSIDSDKPAGETVWMIQDITERKNTDEKFKQLSDTTQTILRTVPAGIALIRNHKFEWVNSTLCGMLGYKFEELLSMGPGINLVNPEDHKRLLNEGYKIMESGEFYTAEVQMRRKDNSILLCQLTGKAIDPLNIKEGVIWSHQDITESKKAEIALAESEAVLKATIESINDGIMVINADRKITHTNAHFRNMFNVSDELLVKNSDYIIMNHAKNQLSDQKYFTKRIEEIYKSTESSEDILHLKNGRILERTSYPLQEDGPAKGRVWLFRDVTEKKKYEEELLKNQKILSNSQRIAQMGNFEFHLETNTVNWGKEMYRIYGCDPEKGQPSNDIFMKLLHPDDHKKFRYHMENSIRSKKFEDIQLRIIRPDGALRYFSYSGEFNLDQNGRPYYLLGIAKDITELKMIEENLREQEAKLRKIFSAAPVPIGMFYQEKFVECNDEFYKMTGYTPDEIIGQYTRKIVPTDEEYQEKSQEYLSGVYKNNVYSTESQWVKKDGTLIDIILRFSPLDPSGTDIRGSIFSALDITERNQALKEIKKLNKELEEKVLKRTAELEMANRDLEAFAYSVSHDLRSPLRHIDGFLSLMHSSLSETSQKTNHYYEKTRAATKRMHNMIEDLLNFSRLGRKKLAYSQIDSNILIREIIEELVIDPKKNNIEWKINELIPMKADRAMLKLAFENLISNAIKYSSKNNKIVIEIGSRELKKGIEFYVKDNGIGFDMKFADKLFNVFQRLHTNEEFDGIGIGLANVKQIIKKHGGTVRAESKPNLGATFYITLPK